MRRITISFLLLFVSMAIIVSSGCLSTTFEVAGDLVETSFDVAGAVAEVPFAVLSSGTQISSSYNERVEEYNEILYSAIDIRSLDAETQNGSIEVRCSDTDSVEIQYRIVVRARDQHTASRALALVSVESHTQEGVLRVVSRYPRQLRNAHVEVHYDAHVPEDIHLKLSSSNAHIRVEGAQRSVLARTSNGWIGIYHSESNADLRTTNGAITVENLKGPLKAVTSNAPIALNRIQGDVWAESANGKIDLQNTEGKVIAHTTNGKIDAKIPFLRDLGEFMTTNGSVHVAIAGGFAPIFIRTENSSIDLALPIGYQAKLSAKTTNGSVKSDFPITVHRVGGSHLEGMIGVGGVNEVKLESTNGSIHLRSWETATRS